MAAADELRHNPITLPLVTLDTNPLIALLNEEPAASAVRELLALHRAELINIIVTAGTGMEAAPSDGQPTWSERIPWIESLGIPRANIYTSWLLTGFIVPGSRGTLHFGPHLDQWLIDEVRRIFHPEMPTRWWDYLHEVHPNEDLTPTLHQALLEMNGLRDGPPTIPGLVPRPTPALDRLTAAERAQVEAVLRKREKDWFNAFNDCNAIHIHWTLSLRTAHPEHAVFVTGDKRLLANHRRDAVRVLGYQGHLLKPTEALAYLGSITGRLHGNAQV